MKVTSTAVQKSKAYVPPSYEDYKLPPLELLAEPEYSFASVQEKVVKSKAAYWKNCWVNLMSMRRLSPRTPGLW